MILKGTLAREEDVKRFRTEAEAAASLQHPAIVAIHEVGLHEGQHYFSMDFVEGTTLRATLTRDGEMPLRRTVEVLRGILAALAHAHAAKLAHGDLRPENVLLTDGGTVVADTGVVDALRGAFEGGGPGAVCAALCAAAYLAPERRDGGAPAGPRDDMYAVGVILHEMLTGRPPGPEGESLEEVRAVPPWLADLARVCLNPDPSDRWPDARVALGKMSPPLKH